jgi:hypothetical protein
MKTLFFNLKYLSTLLLLMTVASCGLDTKVKTYEAAVSPVVETCKHSDAIKDHPICEEFISACVFYACKNETDPNYTKYLQYVDYINNLKGVAKNHSTIIHDSSKCANQGSKIESIIFSVAPSSAGFRDENLSNQPEVSIVRENGQVAKVATPVTLSVHQDNKCADAGVAQADWSMASANPVNTVDGKHLYQNLKFLKNGTYYLKAESGKLKPACSNAIVITENLGIGKKVIFLDPKPSSVALHSRDLSVQPKLGIVNANGDVLDIDNQDVSLALYSDDKCLNASSANWVAVDNPVKTVDGIAQFEGVEIRAGGVFYFRATSGSLLQDCYGPIKVADRLKFSQNPAGTITKGVVLAQQPIVAVSHTDNMVAPFENVPVELKVYTDTQCSIAANSSDYEVTTNPVNSNASGLSQFSGLKFLKEAKFYLRGESAPLLPTDCVSVDVGSNVAKVIFSTPPSTKGIKDTVLAQQPKVSLVDANGNVIPDNGKDVLLTLHSDSGCNDTSIVSGLVASQNPGSTNMGMYQFAGVKIQNAGSYYMKVSSPGVESSCVGPIDIAQKLKLEQSTSATVGVPLANQPKVKVLLPNNSVLALSGVPVEYKIYTNAQCSILAASDKWSMSSTNPVLTDNTGVAQFAGVTLNDVGTYYAKATTTENLDATECLAITTSGVAHSLVFAQPYIPTSWVKGKDFDPQPKVEARDSSGMVLPISIPVELSLHTNSDCSSAPLAKGPTNYWDVNATPNQTTNGVITFAGFKVYKGGKYYLKAKTSSPGVIPACSFEFIVADSLHFNPAGQATMVQNVAATTDTKVQAVWKIPPSTVHYTGVSGESVTISVYSQANCAGSPVPGTDWYFASSNPKATVNGDAVFSGLVFTKVGTYYLKATSPNLEPDCSTTAITVTPGAKKIIFLDPKPSKDAVKDQPLDKQPKVQLVDENNNPITNNDKLIKISVASDSSCNNEIAESDYSVNAPNPAMTVQGMYQFSGVTIKKGGLFYIKASGADLTPACHGPIEIADALRFLTQPSTPHTVLDPVLNATVGPTRPVNIHVFRENLSITVAVYLDNKCETTPYDSSKWELMSANSNGLTGDTALTTVHGKVEFLQFKFADAGEYYLKATSPNLAPACSEKFIITDGSGGGDKGCTEPLAKNYNPQAKVDDCSCVFEFCPIGKPSPDSAQARFYSYKYDKQCQSIPDFIDTCDDGDSCEDKKDQAKADKNKTSGYTYQCDKYKEVYDANCPNETDPVMKQYCSVLKATYEACYRTKKCSKYGLVDDVAALLDLVNLGIYLGHPIPNVALFNSDPSEINYKSSFNSICFKLRFPGAIDQYPLNHPLRVIYEKYCDCTECEDPGICNHPDAENYNPGSGSGAGTGHSTSLCSSLPLLTQQCAINPQSFACMQSKVLEIYCNNKKVCSVIDITAGHPIPQCFTNPQSIPCASACDQHEAPFWYCSQVQNQNSPYCVDFTNYYVSCMTSGQPPANYQGVFPNIGCNAVNPAATVCINKCYQVKTKIGSCEEAKKYVDLYCNLPSTDVAHLNMCAKYKEYYKYCLNTSLCDLEKAKWPYKDLLSLIAALPTYANDANTCNVYNMMWSMCSKLSPTAAATVVEAAACQNFYQHIKSCASGANPPVGFYNLDCSNYNYYLTECKNKCPDSDSDAESCSFRVCDDPNYSNTLGYQKYLGYLEYCKKQNVKCSFKSDLSLCTGQIKGSLRPLNSAEQAFPVDHHLNVWLDDVDDKIIYFGMPENFLVEAVDGLNEVGLQLKPWNESTHIYFYTDEKCSVAYPDPQCIIPHNPSSYPTYIDRVKYSGEQTSGPWACQVNQPNGSKAIMKSFKIKSPTKESLCRPVAVMMSDIPDPTPTLPPGSSCGTTTSGYKICWHGTQRTSFHPNGSHIKTIVTYNSNPINTYQFGEFPQLQSRIRWYTNSSCTQIHGYSVNALALHKPDGTSWNYSLPVMSPTWYIKADLPHMPHVNTGCLAVTQ